MNSLKNLKIELEQHILQEKLFDAYTAAISILESFDDQDTRYKLGVICSRTGKIVDAKRYFSAYLDAGGTEPFATLNLGHMQKALGEFSAAEKSYREFIARNPGKTGYGYWHLSDLKSVIETPETLNNIQRIINDGSTSNTDQMLLLFALGNFYERSGDYDESLSALIQANEIHRSIKPFKIKAFNNLISDLKKIRADTYENAKSNDTQNGNRGNSSIPIFILGMPRSGSTLCEQILASHSLVSTTDELPFINGFAAELERQGSYSSALNVLDSEAAARLRSQYFRNVSHYLSDGSPYFIDKSPINFLHIGLIKKILPNAIIINTYRNSLDNALSLFKRYFFMGNEYAYSFDDIAHYMKGYIDLMNHWDAIFPNVVLHLQYESLVTEPQKTISKLLCHCELEFEPACLEHHKAKRAVLTPSVDQVAKPIYTSAVDSWKKYRGLIPEENIFRLSLINHKMTSSFGREPQTEEANTWTNYWSKGKATSFSNTYDNNYHGEIGRYWKKVGLGLCNGSRVLDIGCGNGGVLDLLDKTISANTEVELIGVDYADIQRSANDNVIIIGNTPSEKLPFSNAEIDLIISQFAIEYSDMETSIKEISRTLKDAGEFKFICHTDNSIILEENRHIYQCSEELILKAFPAFKNMLEALDELSKKSSSNESYAAENREKFNLAMKDIHEKFGDAIFDTGFPEAMKYILAQKNQGNTSSLFEDFRMAFSQAQRRLELLFRSALTQSGTENLRQCISKYKMDVSCTRDLIEPDMGKLGIIIEGRKL